VKPRHTSTPCSRYWEKTCSSRTSSSMYTSDAGASWLGHYKRHH
jgi:hypothetical protein